MRVRMLGGTQVGYQRMTRRWWAPVRADLNERKLGDAPLYFVSSNTHSLSNLVTGLAREREDELVAFVESGAPRGPQGGARALSRRAHARARGRTSCTSWPATSSTPAAPSCGASATRPRSPRASSTSARRRRCACPAQVIPLAHLDPARLDPRLGAVDAERLARSEAVIVNTDYPLGLAAYNLLREVAVDSADLRGVYVLGKAATLNADVGDVMISSVIHDEHSGTTYWLDNAFTVDDIAPDLMFGTGLDNQRAVTVKSTFLQNRAYLDFYYREAFTVVEMEAGPYCNAVYEIADADRYPVGEAVNFSKLPIDFGIIHYASDTPYTQARTLGRPRAVLLRDGLDLRVVAGHPAPGPAPRGRAGVRLHVEAAGPRDGAPVVFLHGVSGSMRTYAWLPEEIADGRRIVRVDLRGHGRSEHAPGAYDVDSYGEDVVGGAARDGGPPRRARRPFAGRRGRLVGGPAPPRARRRRLPRGAAAVHGRARRARAQRRRPHLPDHPRTRSRAGRPRASTPTRPPPSWPPRPSAPTVAHVGRRTERRRPRRAGRGAAADGPGVLEGAADRSTLAPTDTTSPVSVPVFVLAADDERGSAFPTRHAERLAISHPDVEIARVPGAGHGIHDERDHRGDYVAALARFLATHA